MRAHFKYTVHTCTACHVWLVYDRHTSVPSEDPVGSSPVLLKWFVSATVKRTEVQFVSWTGTASVTTVNGGAVHNLWFEIMSLVCPRVDVVFGSQARLPGGSDC